MGEVTILSPIYPLENAKSSNAFAIESSRYAKRAERKNGSS
jgi:hypothetical protein